jgi:alkaline phosphatase
MAEYWHGRKANYESMERVLTATFNKGWTYIPAKAWNTTCIDGKSTRIPSERGEAVSKRAALTNTREREGYLATCSGYEYLRETAGDTAGSMSQMMTGKPVKKGVLNREFPGAADDKTIANVAKDNGMSVGIVSSVYFTHAATAAAGAAHSNSRKNYLDILEQMMSEGVIDVIAAPGHPDFDDNGANGIDLCKEAGVRTFTSQQLAELKAGQPLLLDGEGGFLQRNRTTKVWSVLDDKADIEALASGATQSQDDNLLILPRSCSTLQQKREGASIEPFNVPLLPDVPDLRDLTMAATRKIGTNPEGFFLTVVGGAIGWADHADDSVRMIEEQSFFDDAVEDFLDYLADNNDNNTLDNTLVIVTADHDHLTYGPESFLCENAFQEVTDNGVGVMPGSYHHTGSHANSLVPTWTNKMDVIAPTTLTDTAHLLEPNAQFIHQTVMGMGVLQALNGGKLPNIDTFYRSAITDVGGEQKKKIVQRDELTPRERVV